MKQFLLALSILPLLVGCTSNEQIISGPRVCFDETCRSVEIADDPQERATGLMHRTEMDEQAGMIFLFPEAKPRNRFWMKNTLIALDMIWLDSDKRVVYIAEDVPPCQADPCPSYGPVNQLSQYVLELNAGQVAQYDIRIGTQAAFILDEE